MYSYSGMANVLIDCPRGTWVLMGKNDFVVFAIFNNQRETMKLRSVLERKKIPYIIQDETVVSVDPLQSIGFGNITLKVEEQNVEQVKKILIDNKKEKLIV